MKSVVGAETGWLRGLPGRPRSADRDRPGNGLYESRV